MGVTASATVPVQGRWSRLLTGLSLCLLYSIVALLSLNLAFGTTNVSPVWPPAGVAVAGLLTLGRGYWPAILLGALIANLAGFAWPGPPDAAMVAAALAIAFGNTLEAVLAVLLMNRLGGIGALFQRPTGVFLFFLVVVVATAASALTGAGALWLWGFAPGASLVTVLSTWWLGNLVGVLLVVPLALCLRRFCPSPPRAGSLGAGAGLLVATLLVSWLCFGDTPLAGGEEGLLVFLYLPCLAYAAYRFGFAGVAWLAPLAVGVAVMATIHGRGPFAYAQTNTALVTLDVFALLWMVTGLALAADVAERRRLGHQDGRELVASWAVLLTALGLTVVSWRLVSVNTEQGASARFEALSQTIQSRITDRMRDYEQVLRGGVGLFEASESVSAEEWQGYVSDLKLEESYPGIQGIGYAAYLPSEAALARLEEALRAQGYEGFQVTPCLLYTSPSPRDRQKSRMPSSA